jgi:hypothetical protein
VRASDPWELSSASLLVRGPIHAESDDLPRSEINKLIVKMIMETMPKGGEYHASRESTEKLATAILMKGNALDIDCQLVSKAQLLLLRYLFAFCLGPRTAQQKQTI